MKKFAITLITALIASMPVFAQQTHVNRVYEDEFGHPLFNPLLNPFGVQYSRSIQCANGDRLTVAHTFVTGQGENIFLERRSGTGTQIWATDVNTNGSDNDYGIAVYEDAISGDIYVSGTTDQGGPPASYKAVVIIFDASGNLTASVTIGNNGQNYIATALTIHPTSGNLLVGMSAEGASTSYDYRLEELNPSNLAGINSNIYDHASMIEVLLGIEIDTGTGDIILLGASQNSSGTWSYAAAVFDGSSLNYNSVTRTNLGGFDDDQPLDFAKDASNNIYLTGKTWNGTDFDIKTIKLAAPSYSIAWTATVDVYGKDDVAGTVDVDPVTNEVIIGGFATRTNSVKEMYCSRLNGSSGSIVNSHTQQSEIDTAHAAIKKLRINTSGDVYFVGGERGVAGTRQVIVGKIKASGNTSWQRKIVNGTQDILPSDIDVQSDGIYVISVLDSVLDSYLVTKYAELELDTNIVSYGHAKFKEHELIVRFLPTALDSAAIDNQIGTAIKSFADLSYFMKPSAYTTVTNALTDACRDCEIKAVKIFPGHATTFTSTTSHLGETVAVPDFWTALLLVFPSHANLAQMHNIFNNLTSVVGYAHPNMMAELFSAPDDSLYGSQLSIHHSTMYPNAHVNVEEAWDVIPSGGKSFIRGGVFDMGIDWEHKEFGYDGINKSSSKIIDGWSFAHQDKLKNLPNGNANGNLHATAIAGIIGAQRNNNRGIAGIAGGNDSTGSKGISLYGITIFDDNGQSFELGLSPMNYIANAIWFSTQAANQPTLFVPDPKVNNYCFRLHFQNHSWGLYAPPVDTGVFQFHKEAFSLFSEAMHSINRVKVTAIAARGNDHGPLISYPANVDDDWVICVTGTGTDGKFAHDTVIISGPFNAEYTSGWSGDIDIAAPSSGSLITTLSTPGNLGYGSMYNSFGGTSAAAPHVSGAVGLIMSYMNDSIDNYKNLAPEDCEAILQLSATSSVLVGPAPDTLTGWGRLNIGKAMKLIQKPYHRLLHFGTNSQFSSTVNITLVSSVDTIKTIERFRRSVPLPATWFQKGKYIVKTYKITSTVYHNIFAQDTIIAYWPRSSSSITWPFYTNVGGKKFLTPREKSKITALDHNSATLEGYIYQVKDSLGNSIGWWPVDSAYVGTDLYGQWAEYSVLTKNFGNPVDAKDQPSKEKLISIFPNPTTGNQTILIDTENVCDLTVHLYDIMGRKIKTVYSGKSENAMTVINHDIANLPNSLYIYNININGVTTSRKFIKN